MADHAKFDPSLYDPLIDAEREALARLGGSVDKLALIRAVRGATGLNLREAKTAVERYLSRRGGQVPSGAGTNSDRPASWIDDLLDAERASASKEERAVTKLLLIKALRGASGLSLRDAKVAVEDYLRRRGGEGLPGGSNPLAGVAIVLVMAAIGVALAIAWFRG